jgi:hypothetical protein
MHSRFRGEVAYNGEVDVHFPHLTVGQTLTFATKLRTPHTRVDNMPRKQLVENVVKILGTVFGLRHTFNTKVGVRIPINLKLIVRMISFEGSVEAKENECLLQRL